MLFDIIANTKTTSIHFTVRAKSNDGACKKVERILFYLECNSSLIFFNLGLTREEKQNRINDFIFSVAQFDKDSILLTKEDKKRYSFTVGKNGVNGNYKEVDNILK